MQAMGIAFKAEERKQKRLLNYSGGLNDGFLPVPSVFVVDTKGQIRFEYINPNYKTRLSARLLLAVLQNLDWVNQYLQCVKNRITELKTILKWCEILLFHQDEILTVAGALQVGLPCKKWPTKWLTSFTRKRWISCNILQLASQCCFRINISKSWIHKPGIFNLLFHFLCCYPIR